MRPRFYGWRQGFRAREAKIVAFYTSPDFSVAKMREQRDAQKWVVMSVQDDST